MVCDRGEQSLKSKLRQFKLHIQKLGVMGILPFVFWPLFFLVVTFFIYRTEYNISIENVENSTIIRAYDVAEDFKDYINLVTMIVDTSCDNIDDMLNQGATTDDVQAYLERKSQNLDSIISGDTKGIYGYVRGQYVDGDKWVPDADYIPTERVWYKKAVEANGMKIMVDPYVDARTGKMVVTAAKLLRDKESVISIDIWLSRMQQMTEDVAQADANHAVMIMDESGNVVAHSNPCDVGLNYRTSANAEKRAIYEAWRTCRGQVFRPYLGGEESLLYPKKISDSWTVITMTSAGPAMKELTRLSRAVFASAILGLLITFFVLVGVSRQKIKVLQYDDNIQSIANIYSSLQKIDLETFDYVKISCKDLNASKLIDSNRSRGDIKIKEIMEKLSDERSRTEVLEFVDLSTLAQRLERKDSISMEFLNWDHKWDRARFITAERKLDNTLKSVIFAIEQIDEEKRSKDKLRYLAETDQLTGINNRGSGEDKVRKCIREGEGGMFVLFDVDHFKSINDNFGHNTGDKVLVAIGDCMRKTFRENDIILRLGGDEFAAFAPGVHDKEAGKQVIDRLIASVDKIDIPELDGHRVCISVGAAFYMQDDTFAFEELYKHADSCTYQSKKNKGSCMTFYEAPDEK